MFRRFFVLMDEKKDGDGGGGGAPDSAKELEALKASNAALLARLEKLEASKKDATKDDQSLDEKARAEREAKEAKNNDSKALESALKFSLQSKEWLKTNATLLPKDVEGIFEAAEKEKFDTAVEKASAIKAGIISAFFNQQTNVDLLTPSLKSNLEDWQKLTKKAREEKAQVIFDSIFEPTFEMLKRIRKAEHLNNGEKNQSEGEKALADRLYRLSKKHYLGEKEHGA